MSVEKNYIRSIVKEVIYNDKQMSVKECAEMFNKDPRTIIAAIDRKEIKANKVGKSYYIPKLQFLK